MAQDFSITERRELILAAIERINKAQEIWVESEADPYSSEDSRRKLHRQFLQTEVDFSWQWRNVEAVLKDTVDSDEE